MIEPKNDEERKALRLKNLTNETEFCWFIDDMSRDWWVLALFAARTVVREEQAEANPRSPARENELASVREEIRLRSEVLRSLPEATDYEPEADERAFQRQRLLWLLKRERELMGGDWVTNG